MVSVPHLRNKLLHFYALSPSIKKDGQLAAVLEHQPSAITHWVKGRNNLSPPDSMPKKVLEALAKLLTELPDVKLSQEEAEALWTGGIAEFRMRTSRLSATPLDSVLQNVADRLPVSHYVVPEDSFGMVGDAVDIPDHAIGLGPADGIGFTITGRIGRGLVVLAEDLQGWRVLVPGKFHLGLIKSKTENFPADRPVLNFKDPLGPQRIVFVEYPAELEPQLPHSGSYSPHSPASLGPFADQLKNEPFARKWRWAEVHIVVSQ